MCGLVPDNSSLTVVQAALIMRSDVLSLLSQRTTGRNLVNKLSLVATAREQAQLAATSNNGRASTTVYGGHERALRQTVIALNAGQELAEHENPGDATVHVLSGRVRLVAGDVSWEGRDGDLLVVPPAPHRLEALTDSAVLLTVAKTR